MRCAKREPPLFGQERLMGDAEVVGKTS